VIKRKVCLYRFNLACIPPVKQQNYNVSFQDVDKTNILLKKAGMLDKYEFTNDEIAKVLGVDAIRWCF
jgi:hypothetical protein